VAGRIYTTAIQLLAHTQGARTELRALSRQAVELKKSIAAIGKQKSGAVLVDDFRKLQVELAATERRVKSLQAAEQARERLLGARKKSAPAIQELASRAGTLRDRFASAGRDALVLGATAAAAAAAPLVKFAQFESALSEVSTLVDTSKVSMEGLGQEVRRLTQEFGGDHVTQARALYQTISAGYADAADATHLLTVANKLSLGGVTDVTTAVNGLTTVLNAFSMGAKGAEDAADVMITTMRLGKTTIPELSDFMFQAAPAAAALGVGFDKLSAGVVSLTLQGMPTSVAMTRIRASLDSLVRPSKEMTAAWHALGFKSGTAAIKSLGFEGALRKLFARTKGDAGELLKLLGSSEAVGAALVIGGTGAKAFDDSLAEIRKSAGATDQAAAKMQQTINVQLAQMKARANDAMITIGGVLAPVAGRALARISGWFKDNQARIREWADRLSVWIEGRAIPAVQRMVPEVLKLVDRVLSLVSTAARLTGGFGNLGLAIIGLRLAPLGASLLSVTGGLFKAIFAAEKYGTALRQAAAAARALAAAKGIGAGPGAAIQDAGGAAISTGAKLAAAIPLAITTIAATNATAEIARKKTGGGDISKTGVSAIAAFTVANLLIPGSGFLLGAGAAHGARKRDLDERARELGEARRNDGAASVQNNNVVINVAVPAGASPEQQKEITQQAVEEALRNQRAEQRRVSFQ
jgi:TP901 family phage tail tape measure protein